jgi:hypothetical protein
MGFLLGLFIGVDLLMFGVVPLRSALITVLPLIGLVAGVAWGRLGLLGRAPIESPDPAPTSMDTDVDAEKPTPPAPVSSTHPLPPPPPPQEGERAQ